MNSSVKLLLALLLGVLLGVFMACGPDAGGGGGVGPPCATNADCVPNGCCGLGTGAVAKADAPNCSGQVCNNGCPVDQVNCGCGLVVCSNQHCSVAAGTTSADGGTCP